LKSSYLNKKKLTSAKITAIYFVSALLWIIITSQFLHNFVSSIESFTIAEVLKGFLFVIITSLILYYALRAREKEDENLHNEITRSNKEWRDVFDHSNDSMVIVDNKLVILESNRKANDLFGMNNGKLTGSNIENLIDKSLMEAIAGYINGQGISKGVLFESNLIKQPDLSVPVEIGIEPVIREGIKCHILLFRGIADRKKYEAEIKESENKYRNLVESTRDLIWSLDSEGKITFINSASKEMFGLEPEEMLGRKFTDFVPMELADREIANINNAMSRDKNSIKYISQVLNKNGKIKYLQFNGNVIRDDNDKIIKISGTSIDITERSELENKIENVTNLYSALTKINELLLRGKDEEHILQEALEITVKNGKFKTAWIGFVNETTGKVDVKYFYGENKNYVFNLDININEPPGSRGPIVRSLVDRTHYISNDIEKDLLLSRWSDLSLKYGFSSFATLPIEVGDKVIGTFNIYDDKKNRFSKEITKLLLQLMEDITYALERFELEKQRKHFENLFHNIVDQATIAILMEKQGDVMYANTAAIELFSAQSLKELTGQPIARIVAPEDITDVKNLLEIVYKGERVDEKDVKMLKLNDTEMYTAFSVIPFSVNGENGSLSFIRDITSEKIALDALQASEEKWRSLFENTPSFVTTINREYIITSANRAPLPLRTEEIVGRSILEYIDVKMKDEVRELYEYVFDNGEPSVYHTTGYGEYGREAFFRVQAIPQMKEGGIVHQLTLISSDITETKRASDALLESQMRLNSIVSSALDAIITVDSSLKIVLFNKSAENVFYCPTAEAVGSSITRFIPDLLISNDEYSENGTEKKPDLSAILGKGKSIIGLRANGDEFPIEASVSNSSVESKIFYTIILRDISERIRAENELKDSYQKVRDLAAHLQSAREDERINIAREIHDELGQELSALKMDISFLNKKIHKTKDKPDWNTIEENLKSMTNIADQTIKTVRKISSQLRPDVLDKLGLKDAIEWLADDFSRRTGVECNVQVNDSDNEISKNIQTVIYRISQESLTNIMRHANASKVFINVNELSESIHLEVKDNGKGITLEEIENGRSLGLVGMKERAYFVGGTFEISGEKSKGTKINVNIPLIKQINGA
jgi:PAS domain S-box-containing protein